MKKKYRVGKNFKIVKRSCSLNRYYRVCTRQAQGVVLTAAKGIEA